MSVPDTYLDSAASRSWVGDSNPGELLRMRLRDLRRIRLLVGGISGFMWGSLAFAGTLTAWIWADLVLNLSPGLRITAWLTALSAFIILAVRIYRRTKFGARNDLLASELDTAGRTGGEIRSGLDLSGDQRTGIAPSSPELSEQLADMAVEKASVLVHDVPDQDVAPLTPALNSSAAVGVALIVITLAALLGPRMAVTEANRFLNPFGDQPAYSQYTFDIDSDRDEVIYGDDLEITATVEGPDVDELELVLIPPAEHRQESIDNTEPLDVLRMFPAPSGEWHASVANITEPFDFYCRIRRARSIDYDVNVVTVPQIENVEVEITAPLYTGRSVYRGPVPRSHSSDNAEAGQLPGITGLRGTEVVIRVTSNRPLSGGTLTYAGESGVSTNRFTVDAESSQASAGFVISETGQVDIRIVDEAGQESVESYSIPIHRIDDLPPFVRMMQPKATSFATPTASLPVVVSAEDDYGLRRCQLFRSLNNSRFLPTDLEVPDGTPERLRTGTYLPLASYDLQPGDEIRLFARVEDNDPAGPDAPVGKGAESDIVTVRIISQEDFDRVQQQKDGMKMMQNRHQQAQRRLEGLAEKMRELAEELSKAPADSELADELRKEMQNLAEQMKQEADAIQKLGEKPLPLDLDQELAPQLKQMADKLRELSEQMAKSASSPATTNAEAQEEMQRQLSEMQQQHKKHDDEAMEPLKHMEQVLPLKQAESEFTQLTQRQRQLADRLQSMQNQNAAEDPTVRARMRELEEEQHRLREQLDDLLDRIEEHADNLPEDPALDELRTTAKEFANAVRESEAGSEMAGAEGSLTKFNGGQGHEHADKAATLLEQFLSQCKGMGKQCQSSGVPKFGPSLAQCMANTLSQLAPGSMPGMKQGNKPGMGMGTAAGGGYSSQMSTMKNVGMYGGMPQYNPANTTMGESESDNIGGVFTDPFAGNRADGGSGFTARQGNPAFGGADWGVPIQYRRQAGRYLQGLAEDLEE